MVGGQFMAKFKINSPLFHMIATTKNNNYFKIQ